MLEVIMAVGILVTALSILVQSQSTAVEMTYEAERIVIATQLAQEKLAEVRVLVEREGFQESDVHEEGDFDDFGDDAVNAEFEQLDDYHYEFLITQVDLGLAGDLNGAANNLMGNMGGEGAAPVGDLGAMGISEDMIVQMLEPFIREARVRVWWGDDLQEAEDEGNEVIITTHIINPSGNMLGGLPGGGRGNANTNNQGGGNNRGNNRRGGNNRGGGGGGGERGGFGGGGGGFGGAGGGGF